MDSKNQRVTLLRSTLKPRETNGEIVLEILCKERRGLLQDILQKLHQFPINISRAVFESSDRAIHNIFLLETDPQQITGQLIKELAVAVLAVSANWCTVAPLASSVF